MDFISKNSYKSLSGIYYMTDLDSNPIYQLKLKDGIIIELGIISEDANKNLKVNYYAPESNLNKILCSSAQFILNSGECAIERKHLGCKYLLFSKESIS
jgi:hypothetical protein